MAKAAVAVSMAAAVRIFMGSVRFQALVVWVAVAR
jgi:hypothetical protein